MMYLLFAVLNNQLSVPHTHRVLLLFCLSVPKIPLTVFPFISDSILYFRSG